MIANIISSIIVILGIFLGDYLCSLIFSSAKKIRNFLIEIILFLIIINLFLFNITVADNLFVQSLIYFLVSFVSIITSRSIAFLLFNKGLINVFFKHNSFNSKAIKLAKLLSNKLSKSDIVAFFKNAGFSTSFLIHLKKVLKD